MKNIITSIALFLCAISYAQSPGQNYIKNKIYKVPSTGTVTVNDTLVNVQYFDGLGRPIQTVSIKGGGNKQDIVVPVTYDAFGREAKQYLPYANALQTVSSPNYREPSALLASQSSYYASKFPADAVAGNAYPYSESFFENSPLNRILKTSAPGKDWAGTEGSNTDHTVKINYQANVLTDKVRIFKVVFPNVNNVENTEDTQLTSTGYYPAMRLFKTITKDENWKLSDDKNRTTEEYKDKEGRLILKRGYNAGAAHDTYYVYDNYNNLTYVIPPVASDQIVNEVFQFPTRGINYPWTSLTLVDKKLADDYNKKLEEYDNSEILNANLIDKYGGQGGFSIATDGSSNLVVNINVTTLQPMPYRTGVIADLKELGNFQDKELGLIQGDKYNYKLLIKNNLLYVEGSGGNVPSLNVSLTGDTPLEYSKNYAWTKVTDGDQKIKDAYDTSIATLPNSDILSTYIDNPYGAQGGVTVNVDKEDNVTVSLNITSQQTLSLQKGAVFPLDISRRLADGQLGTVTAANYSYDFSIKDNALVIVGAGAFNSISFTGVRGRPVTNYVIKQEVVEGLCYIYHYDYRNRIVEKHIPDNGWTHIIYDKLNRTLMTQDQKQRVNNNWLFIKYDAFNRPVYTGQVTDIRNRVALQSYVSTIPVFNENKSSTPFTNGGATVHYSNSIFPKDNIDIFSVNYYDNYTFDNGGINLPASNTFGTLIETSVNGLTTATKVRALGTTLWTTTISGYDKRGRAVWSNQQNLFLDSSTQVESKLATITALPTQVNTTHAGVQTVSFNDYLYYDHANRLQRQTRKIGSQEVQQITTNTYDELGTLTSKKVGGLETLTNGLQQVDYTYNIRGWLKSINDAATMASTSDLFAFSINYNAPTLGGTALYNGNISETHWKSRNDNKVRSYGYEYDALNRLTDANYKDYNYYLVQYPTQKEKYTEGLISYDKNGNIMHLERYGLTSNNLTDKIDVLTYNYMPYSNKLKGVSDTSDTAGFNNAATGTNDDYAYDVNGNMTSDLNKGITQVAYNHLNLPVKVNFTPNKYIEYTYDAGGVKLMKKITNGSNITVTSYDNGFQATSGGVDMFFPQPEGYCIRESNGKYSYVYQHKDHLGNIRLSYKDVDNNGGISQAEVQEENNYYAFGMTHVGYLNTVRSTAINKYKYNGKELQDEFGLNMYDYGARNYDPALGRWMNIDPHAESYYNFTPYNYAFNNPILVVDKDGKDGKVTGSGTQEDPYVVTANYYHYGLNSEEVNGLTNAIKDYNNGGVAFTMKVDGKDVFVKMNLNLFEATDEADASQKADNDYEVGENQSARYGNTITSGQTSAPNELGDATFKRIVIDSNKIANLFNNDDPKVKTTRMKETIKSTFIHEIGHNLGGSHGDPGKIMDTPFLRGGSELTRSSVTQGRVTTLGIQAIMGRLNQPRGTVESSYLNSSQNKAVLKADKPGSSGIIKTTE